MAAADTVTLNDSTDSAAALSEKYQGESVLPFTPSELGTFHQFHAYDWDGDDQFQAGLQAITRSQAMGPSFSELLKMKQYYFSTRKGVRIDLDGYLAWRKHLEKPTDDPRVPLFKRFDEYNFDTDQRFQQGLPSFISQLIKDGKNTLDKAALQKELTKARAFYYARYIELFDFPEYLVWKDMEKSQAAPACPYAHLWQNKGKESGGDDIEDPQKIITTTTPVSTGALRLHINSPSTKNVLTSFRLAKISQALTDASDKGAITSIYWTSNSGKPNNDARDPESQIVTKDEKWFTGGIVSKSATTTQDETMSKNLLRQYYSLIAQLADISAEKQKPVVVVIDGIASLSAAYLAFGPGTQRVITENASLSFTPFESIEDGAHQVINPFAGLYLLSRMQAKAAADTNVRPLPKGVGHYLAFCPDYLLRGPDLRKLGLADFFISSSKKGDVEESVLSVAGCPPPHTTQAIRMALNAEIAYPGPAKIDVWSPEIKECFGETLSVEDMIKSLEKYTNSWSKSIREYVSSRDPVFIKLMYRAISDASKMETLQECIRLEYRLGQRYKDYQDSKPSDQKRQEILDNLDLFFEPLESDEEEQLFSFPFTEWLLEHSEDDDIEAAAVKDEANKGGVQSCPHLSEKNADPSTTTGGVIPTDHPQIPGINFSDPEAIKSCPFMASKQVSAATSPPKESHSVPTDHPKIPGVDFSDPEAVKACPFLSAKNSEIKPEPTISDAMNEVAEKIKSVSIGTSGATTTASVPSDHPQIPGVDFSDPEAVKSCPFLSAQKAPE
ncbi:hypothetical protein BGW38_000452 [Lunasporangiospora selenospora]|uniref:3-hydroxyisobutyryl-CoA hydrolase n=1 Tax=Lunasporangiospora selenospora TaxID=979761 RepID=A0A9P6KEY5_9FUNG|nr:hypothetical protein BGW38_000452 [Lunasporangiospora selenospora]